MLSRMSPAIAAYMRSLHVDLVPELIKQAVAVAQKVEIGDLDACDLNIAFGAGCMTAFLEAAQLLAKQCGLSAHNFAEGLRRHAEQIDDRLDDALDDSDEVTTH